MNRTPIDTLLQLAFVEGRTVTRWYYGRSLARRTVAGVCSPASRRRLIRSLEGLLKRREVSDFSLPTVGAFLLTMRAGQSLRPRQIFSRLGLSKEVYQLLEGDRISPLAISPECWRRLRELFSLETERLHGMIRHTHELYYFGPSFVVPVVSSGGRGHRVWNGNVIGRPSLSCSSAEIPALPDDELARLESFLKSI